MGQSYSKMKQVRILFFQAALFIGIAVTACSSIDSPQLKSIENLRLVTSDRNIMQMEADAVFFNPNRGNLKMTSSTLRISVNKKLLAVVQQQDKISIQGESDFRIPLQATISVDRFTDIALKNMDSIFSGKLLLIEFSGELSIKRLGLTQNIPVVYSQEVSPDFFSPF